MGPLAASADSAPVNVLAQSGHSPQGNDDEQDTNDRDTGPVIDPPHIADHETAGGPIYVPQTLPGEENSCRADKHADKQQQHLHFIPPLIKRWRMLRHKRAGYVKIPSDSCLAP